MSLPDPHGSVHAGKLPVREPPMSALFCKGCTRRDAMGGGWRVQPEPQPEYYH
jgi:hypothetical protein